MLRANAKAFIEGRILDIEAKLAAAQVIDVSQLNAGDTVVFGATVTIVYAHRAEEITYQIVGEDEADVRQRLISYASPIARALISKQVGDSVTVQAPGGTQTCCIVAVKYG